ncbi:hypothetical protein BDQ17DRAFT_1409640 [Cyathus striatus]|nr:hypothetical protein BDQ17DRAFT_1409640 [Cyathus striatus]
MGTSGGEECMDDAEEPLAGLTQIDMSAGEPGSKTRAARRSLAEKVSGILPAFREAYISPFDMFIYLLDENHRDFRMYRTELFKEHNAKLFSILNGISASKSGREKLVSWLKSPPGTDLLEEIIEQEMDTLCSDYKLKGLNDITPEYIEDREPDVFIDDAPFTMGLLRCAAQTKRQEQKNVKKKPDQVCNAIMRQLLYQRSGRCLGFAAQFGLYLWATGSARSTIEAIHRFGLSICYQSVLNILGTLGKWCMDLAKTVASGPHAFCYDNLNISTSIHVEQRGLSSTPGKVTSGTLGILYKIPNATPDTMALQPILERMRNPMYSGLDFVKDLTLTDDQLESVSHQFRIHIINVLFKHFDTIDKKYYQGDTSMSHIPCRPLPPNHHTKFYPIQVSTHEEASTKGNLLYHDEVYLDMLSQKPEELSKCEKGSLSYWFTILEKTRLSGQKPDYHTLYIALTQILEGIVLSAWKKICAEEGSTLEEYTSSTPTSEDLHNKAGIVLENYLTPLPPVYAAQEVNDDNANSSHKASNVPSFVSCGDQDDPSRDKAHQNLHLLMRDTLYILELVSAVKDGDIGRVEVILPHLAMIYRGAGSNKYCVETLFLIQNLNDVVRDILIVNPSGIPGHFIATDTNMEYTIHDVKDLIVIKGLQTTWDQIGDTSATIAYLKEIK